MLKSMHEKRVSLDQLWKGGAKRSHNARSRNAGGAAGPALSEIKQIVIVYSLFLFFFGAGGGGGLG